MKGRHGFSLVELLVALVVGLLVLAAGARVSAAAFGISRLEAERAGLGAALSAGLGYLAHELEAAGADSIGGADLDSSAAGLGFRAHRAVRIACRLRPDTVVVHADTALDWSARLPVAGRDSLLLYAPGDTAGWIDAWQPLPLLDVRAAACPGGAAGTALVTALDSGLLAERRFPDHTVVRTFESVAVRAYSGTAGWQLGVEGRSAASLVQPLVGALAPSGLAVRGVDAAGAPVPIGSAAAMLELRLAGRSDRQLAAALGGRASVLHDSAAVAVRLRNAP